MSIFSKIIGIFKPTKHHTYYTFERDLSEEEITENRERILFLLKSINRPGMDNVITYMEKNDFFNIPSSIHHHHNFRGGLAQHVLSVYDHARAAAPELSDESLIVVCLLHDLCKADRWHYDRKGGLHRNHGKDQRRGLKSIKILDSCDFTLSPEERRAIRWHMGGHNAKAEELDDAARARKESLWKALFKANKEDSYSS